MAGILYQKSTRIDQHHSRQSYLVDIRSGIEIHLMVVYPLSETQLANPPFPETRFFEIEIDEVQKDGRKNYAFKHIIPVHARKKPDWHILKFIIKRGSWTITERIHTGTTGGKTQWLYTDDFNILFLSSGGRLDPEMLVNSITDKLDAIAQSIRAGTRIPSEFENQRACRDAFDTLFSGGVDKMFCDAVLYQQHSQSLFVKKPGDDPVPAGAEVCHNHGKSTVSQKEGANIYVNLDQIEDLRDLSWLTE